METQATGTDDAYSEFSVRFGHRGGLSRFEWSRRSGVVRRRSGSYSPFAVLDEGEEVPDLREILGFCLGLLQPL